MEPTRLLPYNMLHAIYQLLKGKKVSEINTLANYEG
jgi:hypothetical protein